MQAMHMQETTELKGKVGELSDSAKSSFTKLDLAFQQVSGELKDNLDQLASQQEAISLILGVITDIRYKAGIEQIDGAYRTLLEGSHSLKSTLEEMKALMHELNTTNSQHPNINQIKEYLELVRKVKGQQAVTELASYVVTVKAEYLIIISLYNTYMEDLQQVAQAWTHFNQDAMEIIKYGGLADVYEGDTVNGFGEGKGTMFYMSGEKYEGDWVGGKRSGKGRQTYPDGGFHEGGWLNDLKHGHCREIYVGGDTYEREYRNGRWWNGKWTFAGGKVRQFLNGKQVPTYHRTSYMRSWNYDEEYDD
jgi:hypothetical protein